MCADTRLDLASLSFEQDQPGRNYMRLLAALNALTDDEAFHLTTRRMLPGTTRFILKNLYNCRDLKTLLSQLASGFNFVHGGNFNRVAFKPRSYTYQIDDNHFAYDAASHKEKIYTILDGALLLIHGVVTLCCPQVRLKRVESKGGNESVLPSLFSATPVELNAPVYQLIYTTCADAEVDPALLTTLPLDQIYLAALHERGTQTSLSQAVSALAWEARFSQEAIAEQMHMSTATLRRKLAEEGVSFRHLCETQRNQLARQLLQQGLTTDEICTRLAFSDERSFNRAFKQWNGVTPSHFRVNAT